MKERARCMLVAYWNGGSQSQHEGESEVHACCILKWRIAITTCRREQGACWLHTEMEDHNHNMKERARCMLVTYWNGGWLSQPQTSRLFQNHFTNSIINSLFTPHSLWNEQYFDSPSSLVKKFVCLTHRCFHLHFALGTHFIYIEWASQSVQTMLKPIALAFR